ncbi:MAG TPA: hypothetical protein VIH99_05435 [Bdellovibrionota bacterium]|jgi:hypothetical protein
MWQKLKIELREKVWDSESVLKLRQKFAELDTQTQSYVLIGSFSAFMLVLLLTFFTLWGKTISLKNELARMDDQIRMAQNSSVRIEELKAMERSRTADPLLRDFDLSGPADTFAERVGTKALIAKSSVEVSGSKTGADLKLNKISLRQLVRTLYLIEKSGSGASVEKLTVDAKNDTEGYLWAQLEIKKDAGAKGGM